MGAIKAIETEYKGYLFRSRLEARWAVFLDALEEEWEYEKEGYELESGRYLPDFWLPRLNMWLEIKGEKPTQKEIELCEELAIFTIKPIMIGWGLPCANNNFMVFCQELKCRDYEERRDLQWFMPTGDLYNRVHLSITQKEQFCISQIVDGRFLGDKFEFPIQTAIGTSVFNDPEFIIDRNGFSAFDYNEFFPSFPEFGIDDIKTMDITWHGFKKVLICGRQLVDIEEQRLVFRLRDDYVNSAKRARFEFGG